MSERKCRPSAHVDDPVLLRTERKFSRVKCRTCGDVFPCYHACDHADCRVERGDPLPEWIALVTI